MKNDDPWKRIANLLFSLPPKNKRYVPKWYKYCCKGGIFLEHRDNIYISYLVARISFFISLFFVILNIISYDNGIKFDFFLFTIDLRGSDYVRSFLLTYTKYTATTLIFIVLPFYLALWRYNFDSIAYDDDLSNNPLVVLKRSTFYIKFIQVFLIFFVCTYGVFGIFAWYMKPHHFENSYSYFLFSGLMMSFLLAILNSGFFLMVVRFIRVLKERHSKTKHSSVDKILNSINKSDERTKGR